jgi:hypothetical protein
VNCAGRCLLNGAFTHGSLFCIPCTSPSCSPRIHLITTLRRVVVPHHCTSSCVPCHSITPRHPLHLVTSAPKLTTHPHHDLRIVIQMPRSTSFSTRTKRRNAMIVALILSIPLTDSIPKCSLMLDLEDVRLARRSTALRSSSSK